jgi:hypothetical protein
VSWADDTARDAYYERRFQALLEAGPSTHHVHRCPVCRKELSCSSRGCKPALENDDGEPMVITTCAGCVEELGKKSNGDEVPIAGYTKAVY